MDPILSVLQFAVDGLSQRQQVTADNLANTDTPGFTAQQVGFESSLQQALSSPNGGPATVTVSADPTAPGANGNNVDTANQLVTAEQTTLQYQTMVEMLNAQFRLIQGAAGGSFQ
jgi:flagellar basal-body rod protein FlgB